MTTGSTPTTVTSYAKKIEEQRFEFVLYINDHIVCQRYFNIRDYNPDSIKSLEMKELIDRVAGLNIGEIGQHGIIPNRLKEQSVDYLWENYNPYHVQTEGNIRSKPLKSDNFQFEIKVDKVLVGKTQFPNYFFTPSAKYQVNIRDVIPEIMTEIRDFLSRKKYMLEY